MGVINKNHWTAYGIVAQEPRLKKMSGDKVMAFTVIITATAGEKVYIPVCAFNEKAHILCSLAHKGSMLYAKGTFKSRTTTTSRQAKTLVTLFLKISEFEVLVKEPVEIKDLDFADTVSLYDPDEFMEDKRNG